MYAISQTSSASAVSGVSWRGGPAVARVSVATNAAHTWGSQGAQTQGAASGRECLLAAAPEPDRETLDSALLHSPFQFSAPSLILRLS